MVVLEYLHVLKFVDIYTKRKKAILLYHDLKSRLKFNSDGTPLAYRMYYKFLNMVIAPQKQALFIRKTKNIVFMGVD